MKLASQISPRSGAFAANETAMMAQLAEVRAAADAALAGGGERSRERHLSRGKMLPRDRVQNLLDPGSPFLEVGLLAAHGLYGGEIAAPGHYAIYAGLNTCIGTNHPTGSETRTVSMAEPLLGLRYAYVEAMMPW